MNLLGKNFIKKVNKDWNLLPLNIKNFKFSESRIDERIMRLGQEAKAYEAEPEEYEKLALVVIKKRILNDFEKHGINDFFLVGTIE